MAVKPPGTEHQGTQTPHSMQLGSLVHTCAGPEWGRLVNVSAVALALQDSLLVIS